MRSEGTLFRQRKKKGRGMGERMSAVQITADRFEPL